MDPAPADAPVLEAPLALGLRQGLLVGLVRVVVTSFALSLALGRVGWPVAGAALGAATAAVEAWGRRRRLEARTIALVAAWTAVAGAGAVAWGQLQGIYFVALQRQGSPAAARESALAAYRGLSDARWRKDGLWFEALPWLEQSQANPRTPLLIMGAAAALTAAARLLRHLPIGRPRLALWTRTLCSPRVLPLLGLLLAVLAVRAFDGQALADMGFRVLVGRAPRAEQAHVLAALGLVLLAGFLIPLAASLSDLVARRPAGAEAAPRPGPWSTRGLALALLGLWLGLVTLPARGWPSAREEGLQGLRGGSVAERIGGLELLSAHVGLDDDEVLAAVLALLADPDPSVRRAVLLALTEHPARSEVRAAILGAAGDGQAVVCNAAWDAVVILTYTRRAWDPDDPRILAALRAALRHALPAPRAAALDRTWLLPRAEGLAEVRRGLRDPEPSVASAALRCTPRFSHPGDAELVAAVRALLKHPDPGLRCQALGTAGKVVERLADGGELLDALADPDPSCAEAARAALLEVVKKEERALAIQRVPDPATRQAIDEARRALGGADAPE